MEIIIPLENELYQDYICRVLYSRENNKHEEFYQEEHHIIPKCMGGSNDKDNLIYLFAQEHYYAHKLLALENPENDKLQHAWWNMCHCEANEHDRECIIAPEDYAEARSRHAKILSEKFSGEGNPNYGKKATEETREKLRKSSSGRKHSIEDIRKMSEAKSGENNPMYGVHRFGADNPNAHGVICIETTQQFESITKAAEALEIKSPYNISTCCKNYKYCCGGYHWCYIEDYTEELRKITLNQPPIIRGKPVICVETGEIFGNSVLAAKYVNVNPSLINNCCAGRQKTGGGLHWKYATEEEIGEENE